MSETTVDTSQQKLHAQSKKAVRENAKLLLHLAKQDPSGNSDPGLLVGLLGGHLNEVAANIIATRQQVENLRVHPDYPLDAFDRIESVLTMFLFYLDNQIQVIEQDPEAFTAHLAQALLDLQKRYGATDNKETGEEPEKQIIPVEKVSSATEEEAPAVPKEEEIADAK